MDCGESRLRMLETVLDGLRVPALLLSDDGDIDFANAAAEAWLFESGLVAQRTAAGRRLDPAFLPGDALRDEVQIGDRRHVLVQRPVVALRSDPQSGLPNATEAYGTLGKALQSVRSLGRRLSVIHLNCDIVRRIGVSLGRQDRLELERSVGQRIRKLARRGDFVCSLGTGAYGVLSLSCDQIEDAWALAVRWVEAMSRPFNLDGREIVCCDSAGVAVAPEHGNDAGELLDRAAAAAHLAAIAGRGEVRVFSASLAQALAEDLDLESALSQAIERNQLSLAFQPKVQCDGGVVRLIGAEALVRWTHPQHGPISPGRFIPLAERSGLMPVIGEWIAEATCAQVSRWRQSGLPCVPIAINVSSHQLLQPDFRWRIENCLSRHNLGTHDISLELTESALLQDVGESIRLLRSLGEMGLSIAIDDFGTGFSSLAYLRRFPADLLKIDRTFVDGIEDDAQAAGILQAIVAMAGTLSMQVIVEGVESEAQYRRLLALGVRQFQGYLFGRPERAEQFAATWLDTAQSRLAATA